MVDSSGARSPLSIDEGYHPRWSPDGKHISYVRDCKVHLLPFNGSDAVNDGPTIDGYVYEWRQDGNLLVGLSSLGRGTQPDGASVYQPDGTLLRTVPGRAVPGSVRLSPNGDLTAITTGNLQPNGAYFFQTVIQATSSEQVLWTLDNVSSVTFSPDSRWIAYEAGPCRDSRLHVLDVSMPGLTPTFISTERIVLQRVWSPDSQKLAFTHRHTNESSNNTLAVFDLRTQNLTTIAPDATNVQWFPDSERLLFDSGPR
jgi:Tol biopolymer transport system component